MPQLKTRLRLDDSLDVLPVHGIAGLLGTLLTGVLCLHSLNPAASDGLPGGHWHQPVELQPGQAGATDGHHAPHAPLAGRRLALP